MTRLCLWTADLLLLPRDKLLGSYKVHHRYQALVNSRMLTCHEPYLGVKQCRNQTAELRSLQVLNLSWSVAKGALLVKGCSPGPAGTRYALSRGYEHPFACTSTVVSTHAPKHLNSLGLLLTTVSNSSTAFLQDKWQNNLELLKQVFHLKFPFLNCLGQLQVANRQHKS